MIASASETTPRRYGITISFVRGRAVAKSGAVTCATHSETASELYALPVRISQSTASTSGASHATLTASNSPTATLTVLSASAVFSRISGTAISSAFFVSSWIKSLEKKAMSAGLLTSLHIVSTTTAAIRCIPTSPRTRRPRRSTGTMIERVGSSTAETYVVATSFSRHDLPSVSGLTLAEMTASISGTTSAFSITEQHSLSAAIAASLIAGFGSCDTSISFTTTSGSDADTDLGALRARSANICTAPSFVCQRCSSNSLKRSGIMPSTAPGLSAAISAAPAAWAAICTGRALSATSCEGEGGADG